jgi:hypothetical protein
VDVAVKNSRFSGHAEDVTWLWPGRVQSDQARTVRMPQWWNPPAHRTRRAGVHAYGPGFGKFFVQSPRNQRVLTKVTAVKNRGAVQSWYKHGAYLQRHGAQHGGRGRGFDAEGQQIPMSTTLARWQYAGDPHMFKVMLSPEHGGRLNLPEYAQQVMRAVERDLGQTLEWIGIDHYNNGHPHVHLCVRGVSNGRVVEMAKSYLHEGIRARAQEVATRLVGVRLAHEMDVAAERAVSRHRWSALDHAMQQKLSPQRTVTDTQLTPREKERLLALAERGLAWPTDGGWQLSPRWEDLKVREEERSKKPMEPEPAHEQPTPHTDPQRDAEREQEDQQRRAVIVDDIEHDLGWER